MNLFVIFVSSDDDMLNDPRIIFYGTPEFAVASLERILQAAMNVVAVVTAPDKPAGRGLRIAGSPVKNFAAEKGLPVIQPVSLKDPSFMENLTALKPDIQVVVAFRMMPRAVWSLPPLGTFNLHASLLPQYRGAAPMHWAIINGETETGVTTFLLDEKIDAGRILFFEKTPIFPEETTGDLQKRLMDIGAELVVKTIRNLAAGKANPVVQPADPANGEILKLAPKFTREDARIDWTRNYRQVFNLIRGMSPNPGAFTDLPLRDGSVLNLKLLSAKPVSSPGTLAGSGIQTDRRTYLSIPATDGMIIPDLVQPAGRRVMNIREFLNGFGRLIC